MKNVIQLFLFFLAFAQLKAQITDSIPPVNQRVFMENLFSNINTTPITSGILMEKGVINVDFRDVDGTLSIENTSKS
jgi:hypothetical protein